MTMREQEVINSRDNAKLKHVRKIRDGAVEGRMFVEGIRLCEELLRSSVVSEKVFISSDSDDRRTTELSEKLSKSGAEPVFVAPNIFGSIAATKTSQGIIATAVRPDVSEEGLEKALGMNIAVPFVIVLHRANNPANVGSVIRTAEAAGAIGVITTENSADAFSPKALRASMGSAFRLPIWRAGSLESVVEWGNSHGLIATAADINAVNTHYSIDWTKPRLLVFGAEAHGLSESESQLMSEMIKIPLANGVESLNLAVSSGIILFEAGRRNH